MNLWSPCKVEDQALYLKFPSGNSQQTVKILERCTGSPEPLLSAYDKRALLYNVAYFHSMDSTSETANVFTLSNHVRSFGPGHAKMCLKPYANNKGADQPAHPRSLISTFVVRCLDSMICILAISKVSRF